MFKNAWFIARKDVQYELKDRGTLLWLSAMPLLFFYFIGTVSGGGTFVSQPPSLGVSVQKDDDVLANQLLHRLSQNQFDVTVVASTQEETLEKFSRRLVIPTGMTRSVLAQRPVSLTFSVKEAGLTNQLDQLRVLKAAYTVLADLVVLTERGQAPTPAAFVDLEAAPRALTLTLETAGQRQHIPSGFEQSIPGTMVMFTLLILLTSGAMTLLIERERGRLRRLAASPITRGQIVLGKWGGKMALAVVQLGFAMLAGTLLFQMDWGPDVAAVGLVLLAWAAFCTSLCVVIANVLNTQGQVAGIGTMATMTLAALGGAWWPIEVTPEFMQGLQKFTPSGWAMDALHKLISFEAGGTRVLPHVAALFAGALALGYLGAKRFKFQ